MKTQQERWDEIVQRMKEKVDEGGRGSVSRLAELLNTERGTVSKYINGQLKGFLQIRFFSLKKSLG